MNRRVKVVSIGAVTSQGVKTDDILDAIFRQERANPKDLKGFKAARYLSQKKMMKAISARDGFALAAIEQLRAEEQSWQDHDPNLRAMFISSPSSFCSDHENYMEAQRCALEEGEHCLGAFGREVMRAQPNTLLQGLPNNVLCYGSMLLDSRGPNNNFTSLDIGGHLAIGRALQVLRRGTAKIAFAGGYSAHTDTINQNMFKALKVDAKHMADGAAFAALSGAATGETCLMDVVAQHVAVSSAQDETNLERGMVATLSRLLRRNDIRSEEVGLVFLQQPGEGQSCLNVAERRAAERAFGQHSAFASLSASTGNLVEAGGIIELAAIERLSSQPDLIEKISIGDRYWDDSRPYIICTRLNFLGDSSAVLIKMEGKI